MIDARPDPDALLSKLKSEEEKSKKGFFKIFFGASAGVGKTYAMLSAARQLQSEGKNVLIGIVETHRRKETEALVEGLPILPMKEIEYKGRTLKEFDLDAVLALKPDLILVDELAHSNVQGSRHPKRWQDVEELIAAGIDVYSTMNVQHLESLNDIVGGITGVRVWETVPDHVFDSADEVVLVDLPPDDLLQRLKQGKVYLEHQAENAIQNFFRKGNLIALRELALRRTADRVDEQVIEYRRDKSVNSVWQTRESILVCVGPDEGFERLIRSSARIAAKLDVPWHAIYIETPQLQKLSVGQRKKILDALSLARELGAETATLSGNDPPAIAVSYARSHNLAKIVVGRSAKHDSWKFWRTSFTERIESEAPEIEITRVAIEAVDERRPVAVASIAGDSLLEQLKGPWPAFLKSFLISVAVTLVALPLNTVFELTNIAMLYLMAVAIISSRYGLGPSVFASFANVLVFDFFFVPPQFSFSVFDAQYLLTFAVMIAVGLMIVKLTTGLKYQAKVSTRRETRMRALYEMSRDLSAALMNEQVAEISAKFALNEFASLSTLLIADDQGKLSEFRASGAQAIGVDTNIAQWAYDKETEAGCGTDTLPGSPIVYLPLKAPMRTRGILAIEPRDVNRVKIPEQHRLLETFASLIAISLERIHYVTVAQNTLIDMESEKLRNSLLTAISHDLRTPLTLIMGAADSVLERPVTMDQPLRDMLLLIRDKSRNMTSTISNLLEMAKMQSGRFKLNQAWQPIEEVVGATITQMTESLENRTVQTSIPDDFPLVYIDAVLMERVITNLIENSIKYTPLGTTIRIDAKLADKNKYTLSVSDDGPGLTEPLLQTAFQKFERGSPESTISGVGLGLSICKLIVEAHGGSIVASNNERGGATFVITLDRGNPPLFDYPVFEEAIDSQ